MTLKVKLNGTTSNPYHQYGLRQNPFPQIAKAEYLEAVLRVQSLGADPIPHNNSEKYIRRILVGFSEEFISLCVRQFIPGEMVSFDVTFS